MILNSKLKFTSKFWKFKFLAVCLVFTGKFCCWIQNHNLPVKLGKILLSRFEVLVDYLPVFAGKFCCWIQNHNLPVTVGKKLEFPWLEVLMDFRPVFTGKFCCWFQNHNLPVTVGKKLEFSKYTGKFRHWIQNRNLPVNLEFLCLTICARVGW